MPPAVYGVSVDASFRVELECKLVARLAGTLGMDLHCEDTENAHHCMMYFW